MKRKDFVDGLTLLGFSLILVALAGEVGVESYLFRLFKPFIMILLLDIGSIFCFISGAFVLFGKGHIWFKD